MIDLALVARSVPRANDAIWPALAAARVISAPTFPPPDEHLAACGVALLLHRTPAADAHSQADDEAALARASNARDALEALIERERFRIVAFVGVALYIQMLGGRDGGEFLTIGGEPSQAAEAPPPDRSKLTFQVRARFGGAVAVALPGSSRGRTPPHLFHRALDLAALRAELAKQSLT